MLLKEIDIKTLANKFFVKRLLFCSLFLCTSVAQGKPPVADYLLSRTKNADRVLVFVHGTPGDRKAFKKYVKDRDLQEKFNMISVDRPGFGKSPFRLETSFQKQIGAISKLVKEKFPNKKATCIGHSYGAPLCLNLMIDKPSDFDEGILIAGPYNPNRRILKWYNYLGSFLKLIMPRPLFNSNKEMYNLKRELVVLGDKVKTLKKLPTILHGVKDKIVPVKDSDYLVEQLEPMGKVKYHRWSNIGHFVIWDRFDDVKKLIFDVHKL